jgi:transcriptional regulator with XRE-family HTH domain
LDTLAMLRRIDDLLRERGMTKADFYSQCKITDGAISQWRTGKTSPSNRSIEKMANVFGVSPEYLIFGVEKENPLVHGDERLTEILEMYEKRSDVRILFGTLPGASPESVMKAAMMIEEDRKKKDVDT